MKKWFYLLTMLLIAISQLFAISSGANVVLHLSILILVVITGSLATYRLTQREKGKKL